MSGSDPVDPPPPPPPPAPEGASGPHLVVLESPDASAVGVRFPLVVGPASAVARSRDGCGLKFRGHPILHIKDSDMSRVHTLIEPRDGRWVASDPGTTSGTQVNGVVLKKERVLADGDEIRCGGTRLVFRSG